VLDLSFNNNIARNEVSGAIPKVSNCFFTSDRFGNEASALYFQGNAESFVNLGPNSILNGDKGTVSLWFNDHGIMGIGYGVESNPIFFTRSRSEKDCNEALYIGVDMNTRKVNGATVNSERNVATIYTDEAIKMARWYHVALTYDDNFLMLYFDGKLVRKAVKKFRTRFLAGDSIFIGNRSSVNNERYFIGCIDDIKIYNRVLSADEVLKEYKARDPNTSRVIFKWSLFILGLLAIAAGTIWYIKRRIRELMNKEKEKNLLRNRWYEQEMRVLKAQMDPHFIFNSLNTIQQFIITSENEKAQLYLSKFSRLIRKLLDSNDQDNISLEQETEILNNYMEIESLRFNNVIQYSIRVSDDLKDKGIKIPHFMIQPIVENSIWHGLLPKEGNKWLKVAFKRINESIMECVVEDNGIGRNTQVNNVSSEKRSLALSFIIQRLELMKRIHNNDYSVQIIDKRSDSNVSEGTKVIVRMPIFNN
jgi:hypothetical protein